MSEHKGFYKNNEDRRKMPNFQDGEDPLLCEYRSDFLHHCSTLEELIREIAPLMEYVKAEIERNTRRAEMYRKITENVLGAWILYAFGAVGYWVISKIRKDIGH